MISAYRFPYKCLKCGLHFNVYSWYENWNSEHTSFCPECGSQGCLGLGAERLDSEIFDHVSAVGS